MLVDVVIERGAPSEEIEVEMGGVGAMLDIAVLLAW